MKYIVLLLAFAPLMLGGCSGPVVLGSGAALIVLTQPDQPPPADTQSQIPEHETWCYRTMGDVQCYTQAQDVQPNRLINVEPQNRYPLTAQDYRDEVAGKRNLPQATAEPVVLDSAPTISVNKSDTESLSAVEAIKENLAKSRPE